MAKFGFGDLIQRLDLPVKTIVHSISPGIDTDTDVYHRIRLALEEVERAQEARCAELLARAREQLLGALDQLERSLGEGAGVVELLAARFFSE